jgi:uncharacterized membrane protein
MTGWLPVAAAIGSALVGGVYIAFSALVIPALRRRAPMDAAATMTAINVAAERAPFLTVFFGTAVASAAVIVLESTGPEPGAPLRLFGAALTLAGTVSTIVGNVPLNRRLAMAGSEQAAFWPRYDRLWTRLNHLRAVLSVVGAVALLVSTT